MKRYLPHKPFPPYAFVPGQHPHPEKPGGHMEHEEVTGDKLDNPQDNEAFLFAIDLYNHEYYWESHVWWEHLWHLEGRRGEVADLLKALIKLAAAKLKKKMGQDEVAQDHIDRALELFAPLPKEMMGLNLTELQHHHDTIHFNPE